MGGGDGGAIRAGLDSWTCVWISSVPLPPRPDLRRTEAGKRRRTGRGRGGGGGRLAAGLPANRTVAAGLGVGIGTRLQNFYIYIFFDFRKKMQESKKF
jgi:hypothetical protein